MALPSGRHPSSTLTEESLVGDTERCPPRMWTCPWYVGAQNSGAGLGDTDSRGQRLYYKPSILTTEQEHTWLPGSKVKCTAWPGGPLLAAARTQDCHVAAEKEPAQDLRWAQLTVTLL